MRTRQRLASVALVLTAVFAAWKSGARWYSCEALVMLLHGAQTRLTSSMKNGFATLPELQYACADLTAANGQTFARRCDEPHNAEYVATT